MMSSKDLGERPGHKPGPDRASGEPPHEVLKPWEKGGPSPNPRGPYHRKHLKSLLGTLDPYAAELLHHERQPTGGYGFDGTPTTYGDVFRKGLLLNASKDAKFAAIYEKASAAAHHAEGKHNEAALEGAMFHRQRYLAEFIERERRGAPRLPIWPDPRDIVVRNMEVYVVGPMDAQAQQVVDAAVEHRDRCLAGINDIVIDFNNVERRDGLIAARNYLRRQVYLLNRRIPPRLKRRIPPLVDHTKQPWGDDEEG
jgi:hypothetical protein